MTHGHLYSLLCATDYVNPPTTWNRLPLGYFITRLSALLSNIECQKKGVKNAAFLPGLGNPLGYDVGTILANLLKMWKDHEPFNLPDLSWLAFVHVEKRDLRRKDADPAAMS